MFSDMIYTYDFINANALDSTNTRAKWLYIHTFIILSI